MTAIRDIIHNIENGFTQIIVNIDEVCVLGFFSIELLIFVSQLLASVIELSTLVTRFNYNIKVYFIFQALKAFLAALDMENFREEIANAVDKSFKFKNKKFQDAALRQLLFELDIIVVFAAAYPLPR